MGDADVLESLEVYSVIVIHHGDEMLLLQRAATKSFAPLQWTGVGGHVESDEFGDLRASALRELEEETGFREADIGAFQLRRVLLVTHPSMPLRVLVYYAGQLFVRSTPECPEGSLSWVRLADLDALDVIADTRQVLPLLIADEERDPGGSGPVRIGLSRFLADGSVLPVVWL